MTLDDHFGLIQDLKVDEGFRAKAYQDTEGVWTVGYGTNLQELVVSPAWALDEMLLTLRQRERECQALAWYQPLSSLRKRVILNMAYNLGMPRLGRFVKMIAALEAGDYVAAAHEMLNSKWHTQVGARAERLAQQMAQG